MIQDILLSKYEALNQCWFDHCPPSALLAQHKTIVFVGMVTGRGTPSIHMDDMHTT